MYSLIKGRAENTSSKDKIFTLIRSIHRIEKGLIMVPRKSVFALSYILETVSIFNDLVESDDVENNNQLQWAYEVLNEYFKSVDNISIINKADSIFRNSGYINKGNDYNMIPYLRKDKNNSISNYDQLFNLAAQRRSVRWYLNKKVPRELIDKALIVANLSPSACNRQPYYYKIFDSESIVSQVVKIPIGTPGFSHNIKTIALLVGTYSAFKENRDRHLIYIDASLSAMSFMLSLETLGLSSCPLNWPEIPILEKRMRKIVNLRPYEKIIMLISIGYPDYDCKVPYSQKKSLTKLREYK